MTLDELIAKLTAIRDDPANQVSELNMTVTVTCPVAHAHCWLDDKSFEVHEPDFPGGPKYVIIKGGIGA